MYVGIWDFLIPEQEQPHVGACEDLSQQARDDLNFMSKIITSNESFGYNFEPATKQRC